MKAYTSEELKEIRRLHGMWRRGEEGGVRADLSGAYLRNADLSGANLRGADLRGAIMSGANLRGANLIGADLSGVNLSGANLIGADLSGVNLSGADLSGADLREADLCGADLADANLADANLAASTGIQYVQFSFQGLGAESRQWGVVKIDGIWKAFCGCWSGNLEDLEAQIEAQGGKNLASRRFALRQIKETCEFQDAA